jgi:hypothetical protein
MAHLVVPAAVQLAHPLVRVDKVAQQQLALPVLLLTAAV